MSRPHIVCIKCSKYCPEYARTMCRPCYDRHHGIVPDRAATNRPAFPGVHGRRIRVSNTWLTRRYRGDWKEVRA